MKCPKCGRTVSTVLVEEKIMHAVHITGTHRRVEWEVDIQPIGLLIFHAFAEDDTPCLFTPADDEATLQSLTAWLLNEDDEVYPEIAHLFSEVMNDVESK